MSGESRLIQIRAAAIGAAVRSAQFSGRDHLVVPVVAMVGDAVVRAIGSTAPEFVPARELAAAPQGWDGRPVLPDHPAAGTASANTPTTLERMAFGLLFNTTFEDGRLKTEAWLDRERAARLGGDAQRVIERCEAGEPVEVSVGCFATVDQNAGTAPSGEAYQFIWRDIVPDHLAMLPEGAIGACSIDMGCGAPRAAIQQKEDNTMKGKGSLFERLLSALSLRSAEVPTGGSDTELRDKLWEALMASEPAFQGIVEVFPDDNKVIYAVAPEQRIQMIMQSYGTSKGGAVELSGDRMEVEPVTTYQEIKAAGASPTPAAETIGAAGTSSCGCGQTARHNQEEGHQMTNKEAMIGRLIACERSPFEAGDAGALSALDEPKLEALAKRFAEEAPAAPASAPAPTAPPAPAAPAKAEPEEEEDKVQLSKAEYEELRGAAAQFRAQREAVHTALVSRLAAAQTAYSEDELKAMNVDQLEKLSSLVSAGAAPVDFTGRGMPTSGDKAAPLPDTWGLNKGSN